MVPELFAEGQINLLTDEWFVPLDIMVGRRFGLHWIASLEYQYGLVRDDDSYTSGSKPASDTFSDFP